MKNSNQCLIFIFFLVIKFFKYWLIIIFISFRCKLKYFEKYTNKVQTIFVIKISMQKILKIKIELKDIILIKNKKYFNIVFLIASCCAPVILYDFNNKLCLLRLTIFLCVHISLVKLFSYLNFF